MSALGLGTAPIGNMFTGVSDADAHATIDAAWDAGIRYFDTAPFYGYGAAEERLGLALQGRPRDEYMLATKVGRVLDPAGAERAESVFRNVGAVEPRFDYSRDGVLRSFEESLTRLGTDRIDVLLVHDPDLHEEEPLRTAFPALLELREQGAISWVGCGMNQHQMLSRFVAQIDLDCVLLAGRYTLLDRSGEGLLEQCEGRGVRVILGGVFNTGILIDPRDDATYDYAQASRAMLDRARRLRDACAEHGVALGAAALQFAMAHPAVHTVLIGARTAAEIEHDTGFARDAIDAGLLERIAANR